MFSVLNLKLSFKLIKYKCRICKFKNFYVENDQTGPISFESCINLPLRQRPFLTRVGQNFNIV